jgi:hypothetical protein
MKLLIISSLYMPKYEERRGSGLTIRRHNNFAETAS